jgi:AraC-like DNA-binding protein
MLKSIKLNCCGHFINMPTHLTWRSRPTDYLIIWAVAGRGFAEVERRNVDVLAGDLLVLRPGVPQYYGADADDPWEILWMHAAGSECKALAEAIRGFAAGGPCVRLGRDDTIRERFIELVVHSGRTAFGVAGQPIWPDTEALALLGLIWRRLDQLQRMPERSSPLDASAVQRYVHDNLSRRITLDDMAAAANLSPAHFARLFRAHFGTTPIRYVNQKRVDVACAMLAESDMKLWQIARQAGFEDPYYFSRLFHKTTGVPPSEYRRRLRVRKNPEN